MIKVNLNLTEKELDKIVNKIIQVGDNDFRAAAKEYCRMYSKFITAEAKKELMLPYQELTNYVKKIHKNQDYLLIKLNELEEKLNEQ